MKQCNNYSTVPNNCIATAIYFKFFPLQVCLYQSSYAYSFPKFRNWLLLTKAKTYLCHGIFEVLSVCRSSICIYFFPLGMLIHSVVTMFLQFRNSYLTFFHQVCLFRQLLLLISLEGSDSYGYWSSYIYQGLQSISPDVSYQCLKSSRAWMHVIIVPPLSEDSSFAS